MARAPQYTPQLSAEFASPRIGVVRPRTPRTAELLSNLGDTLTRNALEQSARDENNAIRKARYDASQVPLTAESIILSGDERFKDLKLQGTLPMPKQEEFDAASTAYYNIMNQRISQMNRGAYQNTIGLLSAAADGDVERYAKGVDEYRKALGGIDLSTPDGAYFVSEVTRGQNNVAVARANDERKATELEARSNLEFAFNFGSPEQQAKALASAKALNLDVRAAERRGKTNIALTNLRKNLASAGKDSLLAQQKAINDSWPAFANAHDLPKEAQTAALRVVQNTIEMSNNLDRDRARATTSKYNERIYRTRLAAKKTFEKVKNLKNPREDIVTLGETISDLQTQRDQAAKELDKKLLTDLTERDRGALTSAAINSQTTFTQLINEAHKLLKFEQGELKSLLDVYWDEETDLRARKRTDAAALGEVNEKLIELAQLSKAQKGLPPELRIDPTAITRVSTRWDSLRSQILELRKSTDYARDRLTSPNTQYSNSAKDQAAAATYADAFTEIENEVLIDHINPGFGDPAAMGQDLRNPASSLATISGSRIAQEFMAGVRESFPSPIKSDRNYDPRINAAFTQQAKAIPAPMAALIDGLEGNKIPLDADGRDNFENVVQFMASMKADGIGDDTFKKLGISTQMIDRSNQYIRHMRVTRFSDEQLSREERSDRAIAMMTERESEPFAKGLQPDLKEIFNANTPANTPQIVARKEAKDIIQELAGKADVPPEIEGIVAQKLLDTAARTGDLSRAIDYTKIDLTGIIGESELGRSMTASPTSDGRTITLYPPESLARKYRNHNQVDDYGRNLADYANHSIRSYVKNYYPEYADKLGKSVFLQFDLGRNQYFLFEGASGLGSGDITIGAYQPQYLSHDDGSQITIPVEAITQQANGDFQQRLNEAQSGEIENVKENMEVMQGRTRELVEYHLKSAKAFAKLGQTTQRNKAYELARQIAKRGGVPFEDPFESSADE